MQYFLKYKTVILMVLLASCASDKAHDYHLIGENLCNCAEDIRVYNAKFKVMLEKKQTDKIMTLMDTLALAENKLKACILSESKSAPFLKDEKAEKHLLKALYKICPEEADEISELAGEIR